jgi:hypothetical protein
MVPLDLNRLISTEASGLSRQSSLSTANHTANSVRIDERTPDILINESGENPHTPATTSFTSPYPDPVLVTVTSSTVPRPPSVSAQQPGEFPDTPQLTTVIPNISHPLDTNSQQGIVAPYVASDITQILSTTSQIPYTISVEATTLKRSAEPTACPPTTVSDFRSSPIIVPAFHSGVTSLEPPSSVEFPLVQTDDVSHALGSPFSHPVTALSDNSPVVTASDPHDFANRDPPSTHDTPDVVHSIPTETSHHINQPAAATPNTVPSAIRGDPCEATRLPRV